MNKRKWMSAVCSAALLWAPRLGFCAFQQSPLSPRATVLGGVALEGEDSSALFFNPGALAGARTSDLYFMYNQLYAGLQGVGSMGEGLFSVGVPTGFGSLAAGVSTFYAQGLENERVISLGYSRRIGRRLEAGVAAKQLYQSYSIGGDASAAADPVFSGGSSRSAYALDAGVSYSISAPLRAGLAVRNINSPNMGLSTVDRVPREIQGGLAYEFARYGLRTTGDVLYRNDGSGSLRDYVVPSVGFEKIFYGGAASLRLGVDSQGLGAGFGLALGAIGIDYAFVIKRNLSAGYGSHQLGLRYRFGVPSVSSKEVVTHAK